MDATKIFAVLHRLPMALDTKNVAWHSGVDYSGITSIAVGVVLISR